MTIQRPCYRVTIVMLGNWTQVGPHSPSYRWRLLLMEAFDIGRAEAIAMSEPFYFVSTKKTQLDYYFSPVWDIDAERIARFILLSGKHFAEAHIEIWGRSSIEMTVTPLEKNQANLILERLREIDNKLSPENLTCAAAAWMKYVAYRRVGTTESLTTTCPK